MVTVEKTFGHEYEFVNAPTLVRTFIHGQGGGPREPKILTPLPQFWKKFSNKNAIKREKKYTPPPKNFWLWPPP